MPCRAHPVTLASARTPMLPPWIMLRRPPHFTGAAILIFLVVQVV